MTDGMMLLLIASPQIRARLKRVFTSSFFYNSARTVVAYWNHWQRVSFLIQFQNIIYNLFFIINKSYLVIFYLHDFIVIFYLHICYLILVYLFFTTSNICYLTRHLHFKSVGLCPSRPIIGLLRRRGPLSCHKQLIGLRY